MDIFFVISGFLITGLLLREYEKTGSISFVDFYKRRIRRIMPLAALVLAATMAVSWFVLSPSRANSVIQDGLWSLIFAGNWRFALTGTDYMQADGPVSPLQHFWSLAVEEQFYIVWPVLILLVLWLTVRRLGIPHARAAWVLMWVMVAVCSGSFIYGLWETATNPTVAYFSTFSRAWELGVGAIIAASSAALARIPEALRTVLSYVGLVGIAVSLFVVSSERAFPAPWALLPVLSTALVVAAGVGSTPKYLFPLTNRVSNYLGDISYSLYLWHFPVIILVAAVAPVSGPVGYGMILVVILLLSSASYHFIEDPIRRSRWLDPKNKSGRKRHVNAREKAAYAGVALLAVAAVVVASLAFRPPTPPPASAEAEAFLRSSQANMAPSTPEPVAPDAALADLKAQIVAGVDAQEWPERLTPALEDLSGENFAKADAQGCAPATPNGKDCIIPAGDMSKTAVVVGDSMAIAWLPAIRAALEPAGWRVFSMTYAGCPLLQAETGGSDPTIVSACGPHKALVAESIANAQPGLVIMSNNYGVEFAQEPNDLFGEWGQALAGTYREWLAPAGAVVTLSAPPRAADPEVCATRFSKPSDCLESIPERWATYAATDQRIAEQNGSRYIATRDWFCDDAGRCPLVIGDTVVRRDATHITSAYAEKVAPLLQPALLPAP